MKKIVIITSLILIIAALPVGMMIPTKRPISLFEKFLWVLPITVCPVVAGALACYAVIKRENKEN
ncbi:MAG: hypothetical protein GF387_00165 [Candidatus Portnoybacteria bacterium]|nr:hypothetical protein [Candidatus Portnoybacteria bacterium]